jgi:hypothetical protein
MTFSIELAVILTFDFRPLMRRYHCFCAAADNLVNQCLSRIPSVSNHIPTLQVCQQSGRLGDVMGLSARQAQAQRITQSVNDDVDFSAEPASTTSQRLRFLPAAFFVRQRRTGVHAPQCCQSSHFPCPLPQRSALAFVPTPLPRTSGKIACKQHSNPRTRSAAVAIARRCALSIRSLRQNGGSSPLVPHTRAGLYGGSPAFLSTGRLKTLLVSYVQFISNVNRT